MLIRAARPGDAPAVARLHVRAWQHGYRGLLPDQFLDRMSVEERAARYRFGDPDPQQPATMVAVEGGAILGFATTAPARDADAAACGELCGLYIDPDCWSRGTGSALLAAAQTRLLEQGFAIAVLWVLRGNVRGRCFYEHHGWAPDGAARVEQVWGAAADEVRYRCRLTL
jgi:GNAT superfamily N-acetyltransferase